MFAKAKESTSLGPWKLIFVLCGSRELLLFEPIFIVFIFFVGFFSLFQHFIIDKPNTTKCLCKKDALFLCRVYAKFIPFVYHALSPHPDAEYMFYYTIEEKVLAIAIRNSSPPYRLATPFTRLKRETSFGDMLNIMG